MKKQPVIMLVEDNEDEVFLIRRALRAVGLSECVHSVLNGEHATRILLGEIECPWNPRPLPPDLVLLDLNLPGRSGFEVLQVIRRSLPVSVPVVMLSASNQPTDIQRAYECGANSYVVKPVDLSRLTDFAKALAQYWFGFNNTTLP